MFKSPQRKWVGWGSLWVDFTGWVSRKTNKKNHEVVWICVGNFNRSHSLLNNLIASVSKINHPEKIGFSIFDCGSTDAADLKMEIEKIWKGGLVFNQEKVHFSRSSAFNAAIKQAPGELIFVCDADIQLPPNFLDEIYRNVSTNSVWFPICQWQLEDGKAQWRWFTEGTGIFAATKKQLQKTGVYNLEFTTWGKEDWDLFFRFYQAGIVPHRTKCIGLYHVWHPSSKPDGFVKLF